MQHTASVPLPLLVRAWLRTCARVIWFVALGTGCIVCPIYGEVACTTGVCPALSTHSVVLTSVPSPSSRLFFSRPHSFSLFVSPLCVLYVLFTESGDWYKPNCMCCSHRRTSSCSRHGIEHATVYVQHLLACYTTLTHTRAHTCVCHCCCY